MENVTVRIGDCACPDAPHPDGDVVYMRPTVSLVLGLACERIIANARAVGADATTDALMVAFVTHGAVGWNREQADGKPEPFSTDLLLEDFRISRAVAEKADDLYAEVIMAPLVEAQQTLLRSGQTAATTRRAGTRTRSRSKSSSASTSAGVQ